MIRLALCGGGAGAMLFVVGVTDFDVTQLTRGQPLVADLRDIGGEGEVVIVHGRTVRELRDELTAVMPEREIAKVTATLDQLGAMERDAQMQVDPRDAIAERMQDDDAGGD
jgi:hypothetical protein